MTPPQRDLPPFHRSAIDPCLAAAHPVARVWPLAYRLAGWAALAACWAAGWLAVQDHPIDHPVGSFHASGLAALSALAALALAWLTLRSAIPGGATARHACLALVPFASVVMLALTRPPGVGSPGLVSASVPHCTLQILSVSLIPGVALVLAAFRAAPLRPRLTLAAAGGAALLAGAAAVTLFCPIDVRSHVLVAHLSPSVIAAAIGAGIGSWRA